MSAGWNSQTPCICMCIRPAGTANHHRAFAAGCNSQLLCCNDHVLCCSSVCISPAATAHQQSDSLYPSPPISLFHYPTVTPSSPPPMSLQRKSTKKPMRIQRACNETPTEIQRSANEHMVPSPGPGSPSRGPGWSSRGPMVPSPGPRSPRERLFGLARNSDIPAQAQPRPRPRPRARLGWESDDQEGPQAQGQI